MTGLGNSTWGEKLPGAYCPAGQGSGGAIVFKGHSTGEERVYCSQWKIRSAISETGTWIEKGYHDSTRPRTSEGRQRVGVGVEPPAVGWQLIQASGRWSANQHEVCGKGRQKRGHHVSRGPTVPAKHKQDSAISQTSATGDSYFTDQPRLKTNH